MADNEKAAAVSTTREERLRIVEAVMPGFWAVARPGTNVRALLTDVEKFVQGSDAS